MAYDETPDKPLAQSMAESRAMRMAIVALAVETEKRHTGAKKRMASTIEKLAEVDDDAVVKNAAGVLVDDILRGST